MEKNYLYVEKTFIPANTFFVQRFQTNGCGRIKQPGAIWKLQSDIAGLAPS